MSVRDAREETGRLTFHVTEVFAAGDASAIREALRTAGDADAAIDFHRVRRCEPVAVALLSKEIVARRGRVLALGMCMHERRLLGYFGVPRVERLSPREGGQAWGRPVDVETMRDGSLLVSDDKAGVIYRITYAG